MKTLLSFITFVAWALWFGGSIAIFVFGSYFQKTLSPATFHETATALFHIFSKYELILAAIVLISTSVMVVVYPTKASVVILGCMVLAGGMAVTFALGLMPAMDELLKDGLRDSTRFKTLHGKSMVALLMQSLVLLGTGWIIQMSQRNEGAQIKVFAERETSEETARV